MSVPLHKLKVVKEDGLPENSQEIEKILDHKKEDDQILYLVKWKDSGESWIPEDHFNTVEVINDYYNSKNEDKASELRIQPKRGVKTIRKPETKKKRGRPPKLTGSNLVLSVVLAIFFLPLVLAESKKINNKFKFCDITANPTILDVENSCQVYRRNMNTNVVKIHVLDELRNQVEGKAYECRKIKTIATTYKNFFGVQTTDITTKVIKLSRDDCFTMVKTNKCNGNPMFCENNHCWRDDKVHREYKWLTKVRTSAFSCEHKSRIISAHSHNSSVFGRPECLANKLFCQTHDSIIFWEKNVLRTCNMYKVTSVKGVINDNIVITKEKLAFYITGHKYHKSCKTVLYTTTEGLYLSLRNTPNIRSNSEENEINKLQLAEEDSKSIEHMKFYQKISNNMCNLARGNLYLLRKSQDVFTKIYDNNLNEVILYSNNGVIYFPKCLEVPEITLKNKTVCHKDFSIEFMVNETKFDGFLRDNQIITKSSPSINCDISNKLYIVNSSVTLKMNKGITTIEHNSYFKVKTLQLDHYDLSRNNFEHNRIIKGGASMLDKFIHLINEDTSLLGVEYDVDKTDDSTESVELIRLKSDLFSGIGHNIKKITITISVVILLVTLIVVIMASYIKFKPKTVKNNPKMKEDGNIFHKTTTVSNETINIEKIELIEVNEISSDTDNFDPLTKSILANLKN